MKKLIISSFILMSTSCASAWTWQDLWWRKDEQGKRYYQQNNFYEAAKRFDDPQWKAVAQYRSGNYGKAFKNFGSLDNPVANYNRGTALARLGYYQDAVTAYERAIAQQTNFADAHHNLRLVKQLIKKQHQQQPQVSASKSKRNTGVAPQPSSGENKDSKRPSRQPPQSKQSQQAKQQPQPQKTKQQREKEQAQQQWLRQIDDDPGSLLQNKFRREHQRRYRYSS